MTRVRLRRLIWGSLCCASIGLYLSPPASAIETAGELFVNLDAATFGEGDTEWANPGTYVDFEADGLPTAGFIETTPAVFFDGTSAFFGRDFEPAPEGLTGFNPTRSIEVWALNPTIDQEETMISWGHRGGPDGSNMSFNYGFRGEWGAVGHWGGGAPDLGWIDNNWTGGAPERNKWHHLVYTYDETTTRVYSDGVLWNEENVVDDLGVDLNTYDIPPIAIASQWDDDFNLTAGIRGSMAIGRVRVHDEVLTPVQILANYNEEKPDFVDPPPVPLTPEPLTVGPVHQYSFDGDANDSVGGANGVLVNNTGDATYVDGEVVLGNTGAEFSNDDTGDYIDLPNGIVSALGENATFEVLTTWGGPVPGWWQRIFDLGTSNDGEDTSASGDSSTYIFATPYAGDTETRVGYRYGPDMAENILQDDASLPVGEEAHVALVWNGDEGQASLYVDGEKVAENVLHFGLNEMDDNNNWLGRSQWNDAMYVGSYDEFRIYDYALTEGQVYGNFLAWFGPDLDGDYNNNGTLDAGDLDMQAVAISGGNNPPEYDLNGDDLVNFDDRLVWVDDLKKTWIGDANLDLEFNSGDMVQVFSKGKYETGETAGWEDGDWNADLLFSSGDMVAAFVAGGYEKGQQPAAVSAVPEPSGLVLLMVGVMAAVWKRRRR